MGVLDIGDLFAIGIDILKTTRSTIKNSILAQLGDVVSEQSVSDEAEWWQHVGFASRPSPATKQIEAAQGIAIRGNDRDRVIASRDVRGQQITGNLDEGETCVYACGADGNAQGRAMFKKDGSVTLYTTDNNAPNGNAVFFRISPKELRFTAPWGTVVFDSTGFHVVDQSGARLDLAGIGGLPAPLSAVNSIANLQAAAVTVNGSVVQLGPKASVPVIAGPSTIQGVASTSVYTSP